MQSAQASSCTSSQIRWASSSNTIYVTGGDAVCTLTDIDRLVPRATITLVDPAQKIWFVGTTIWLQQGATLQLYGANAGGDANEIRLKSNAGSASNSIVWLRAYWGNIDIKSTRITSWDEARQSPDTDSTNQRSYIQVRSFLDSDGITARQSRMNIADSDIGYLGYYGAEAYGLSWKVLGSSPGLFDKVDVLGSVINSRIHHNYYGVYTYGGNAMEFRGNEFDNNVLYGLDPHDNSDNLIIENNQAHNNGTHGIICSRFCDHLTIRNNRAYNNGGNGIMLHRLTDQSLVEDNEAYDNGDSGIAIFDSHHNTIRHNTLYRNAKGIRFSVGSSNNFITDNTITDNRAYGIYFYKGSDEPTISGDGRPTNNQFINNEVRGNGQYGLKMKGSDYNLFQGNQFIDNGDTLLVDSSVGNRFADNLIDHNGAIGLTIKNNSDNTTVTGNTISNHTSYGIFITSSANPTITNNTFSNNGQTIGP